MILKKNCFVAYVLPHVALKDYLMVILPIICHYLMVYFDHYLS